MASPLSIFRKYQYYFLVVFGIMLMIAFVVLPPLADYTRSRSMSGSNQATEVVLTWKGGSVDEADLRSLNSAHQDAMNFLDAVEEETRRREGFAKVPKLGRARSESQLVEMLLLARKAGEMQIEVSDDAIRMYLDKLSDGLLTGADYNELLSRSTGDRLSKQRLYNQLRQELMAYYMRRFALSGVAATTPNSLWEMHEKMHHFVKAEVLPLRVADFLPDVKDKPTDGQLRELYEAGKERFPNPNSPEPGFRRRTQIDFEFLRFDFNVFLDKAKSEVTDEEIRQRYAEGIVKGEYRQTAPSAPFSTNPATSDPTSPTDPTDDKPADDKPADDKPADDKPADDKPADDKPADDKPADDKPADDKPADDKPADDKPADDKSADDKPADDKPADDKPADDKPADDKPADDKPADDKPADEKPADEKPADEKPADEKPEDDKPADDDSTDTGLTSEEFFVSAPQESDPPADDPKDEKPSNAGGESPQAKPDEATTPDVKPADDATDADAPPADAVNDTTAAKPTDGDAETEEVPPPAEPQVKPLEEVRDEIVDELAKPRAEEAMKAEFERVLRTMRAFSLEYEDWLERGSDKDQKSPEPPNVEELASKHNAASGRTGLVDVLSVREQEIGKSRQFSFPRDITFSDVAFTPNTPLFFPEQIDGEAQDVTFLYWRVEQKESFVPEFKDVRGEVETAWKMSKARELAKKAAEDLANEAKEKAAPPAADPEGPKTVPPLKDCFPSQASAVVETNEFSWLTQGNLPVGFGGGPELSTVEGVEGAGPDFMEKVFAMKAGDVGVASNVALSDFYVVRIKSESPTEERLKDRFLQSGPEPLLMLARENIQRYYDLWYESLETEMKVVWLRPPEFTQR